MKKFMKFSVVALGLMFAVQANASGIEVSKDKKTVSLFMNTMGENKTSVKFEIPESIKQEVISYNVSAFKVKVDDDSVVSGTGIYDEGSEMAKVNGELIYKSNLLTPGGEVAFVSSGDERSYTKGITLDDKVTEKDGKKTTTSKITGVDMDSVKSGFSLSMIKVNKEKYVFFLQQSSLEEMNKFNKNNVIFELPVVKGWETFNTVNVKPGKVVRFDSGVYESKGGNYKNVYVISIKNVQ